ncbi:hypothetical protein [Paraburkholderia youngii]|uniref:hypothetical protein n=1 Tax=Paraburkholderia youngii TaxID=2782701 RepID=UPI003D191D26
MGFLIYPLAVAMFCIGLTMQFTQTAQSVPGSAAWPMHQDAIATITAQQSEVFASACLTAALTARGVVSQQMTVVMPAGTLAPASAVCATTAAPGGGRYVYAYSAMPSGMSANILKDTYSNPSWYRVSVAGQAANLVTGLVSAVPATIPVGDIVQWLQVNP